MTNRLQYYQEVKVDNICSKCGRTLTVIALGGKVFKCCLRCTNRVLVSRVSSKKRT